MHIPDCREDKTFKDVGWAWGLGVLGCSFESLVLFVDVPKGPRAQIIGL